MKRKNLYFGMSVVIILAIFLGACGGETSGSEKAAEPTEMHLAAILTVGPEQAWDRSFLDSFKRVQQAKPHGLTISDPDITEAVFGDEAEVVMREYAASGKYDIIWANSSYSDQVKKLKDEFPEILWVVVGSGNEAMGGNAYWVFQHLHESAYLLGILAGHMTKTDTIGIVSTFPSDDVNDFNNGFIDGAKSVNPEIKAKVMYIESWYDPAKGAEAAYAQIAAGADQMLMSAEAFEPCVEKQIMCYAHYIDYGLVSPDAVAASAIMNFDPAINWIIDEWWQHKTTGEAYAAPMEAVWFSMAEGSSELSPYHNFDAKIPQEVKDAVKTALDSILNGTLKVPLKLDTPTSDS